MIKKLILFIIIFINCTLSCGSYTLDCNNNTTLCNNIEKLVINVEEKGYDLKNIYITINTNNFQKDFLLKEGVLGMYSTETDKILINPNIKDNDVLEHCVYHELGHYIHKNKLGVVKFLELGDRKFKSSDILILSGSVSSYALTNPVEFVAEVFSFKMSDGLIFPIADEYYIMFEGI